MRLSTPILFLFFYISGYAQESFKFINYSTVNGLADNRVGCITQDSRGFMWFGTSEGLSRFDGDKFENYFADPRVKNSLPDNSITSIYEYKPGHLLLLTGSNLCCLNTFTRQFYSPPVKGKNIYSVSKNGTGNYIISCMDTSYILNNNLEITDTLPSPLKDKGVIMLTRYLNKQFILSGRVNEYYLYDTDKKKYTLLFDEAGMPGKEKTMLFRYYDSLHSSLYFSSYFGGIYQYDLSGRMIHNWSLVDPLVSFHNGNISFIVAKNDSILWLGNAEEEGLLILNRHNNRFSAVRSKANDPGSLASNSLYAAFTDNDGNEWLGTAKGISKINRTAFLVKKWMAGQLGPVNTNYPFMAIKKGADGNFYTARFGSSQIWKINKGDDDFTSIQTGQPLAIWCLNNFGKSIIATGGGQVTVQYDPITKKLSKSNFLGKYFPQSDIVVLAFRHSNGDEWYSGNAGGGFIRISAKDKTIHQYKKDGPAGNFFISYYPYHAEDKKGDLWFGVNKSSRLLHWNMKTEHFKEVIFGEISNTSNQAFKGITDLCIDRYGNIWTGFDGSGIVRYDPTKNETAHYTISDGLASDYISSMTFDDKDRLWIGTFKGLTCFITTENKFINFTRQDGLPDDYFAERCILFDSSTHQLWIGGASALMRFDPEELLRSGSRKFPVYIDAITVNNELFLDQNAGYTSLIPSQNNLQFTFIGLDPESVKNIEYSYQLIGADKDWISNSTTTASYNNLGPGKYTFIVRARHKGDTEWMTLQDPFQFFIETPWHKTWWFRLILTAAIIALSWILIRTYYRNKFLRQKAMMEKEIAIEQERTKMARELHDGLGSMLSGIKHSFTAMTKEFELNDKQKLLFHANLDKLNESIRELRNISHNMASDALLKYGLENSLRDYCYNASLNSGIPVSFTALDTKDLKIDEEKSVHIFRIIQELFQNIIKHSDAKNIVVQLSNNHKQLYITVEDDGKGFDMAGAKKQDGIGLKNIESRIKLLKGDLDYKTAPGKGTSVMMTIPVE